MLATRKTMWVNYGGIELDGAAVAKAMGPIEFVTLGETNITPKQMYLRCLNRGCIAPEEVKYGVLVSKVPHYEDLYKKYGDFGGFDTLEEGKVKYNKTYAKFYGITFYGHGLYSGCNADDAWLSATKARKLRITKCCNPGNNEYMSVADINPDKGWPEELKDIVLSTKMLQENFDLQYGIDYSHPAKAAA